VRRESPEGDVNELLLADRGNVTLNSAASVTQSATQSAPEEAAGVVEGRLAATKK